MLKMTPEERDELERIAREEYERGHEQVDATYAEKMRSIANVFEMLQRRQRTPSTSTPTTPVVTDAATGRTRKVRPSSGPMELVRAAIDALRQHFTMPDIHEWIATNHPTERVGRPAISSCLNKLMKQGKIRQEKKGTSKNDPTVWAKVEKPAAQSVQLKLA